MLLPADIRKEIEDFSMLPNVTAHIAEREGSCRVFLGATRGRAWFIATLKSESTEDENAFRITRIRDFIKEFIANESK